MKPTLLLIYLLASLSGCQTQPLADNQNSTKPTPTATVTEEEAHQSAINRAKTKAERFQAFVKANYPGWTLKGFEDEEAYPFADLHLVQGDKNKIVKVNYKRYTAPNGEKYPVVSRVVNADLFRQEIKDAEERGESE